MKEEWAQISSFFQGSPTRLQVSYQELGAFPSMMARYLLNALLRWKLVSTFIVVVTSFFNYLASQIFSFMSFDCFFYFSYFFQSASRLSSAYMAARYLPAWPLNLSLIYFRVLFLSWNSLRNSNRSYQLRRMSQRSTQSSLFRIQSSQRDYISSLVYCLTQLNFSFFFFSRAYIIAACSSNFFRYLSSLAFLSASFYSSVVLLLLILGLYELSVSLASQSFSYSSFFFLSLAVYLICSFLSLALDFIYFLRFYLICAACSYFSSFTLYFSNFFLAYYLGFQGYRLGLTCGTVGFGFVFSFAFFCSLTTSSNRLLRSIFTSLALTSAILLISFISSYNSNCYCAFLSNLSIRSFSQFSQLYTADLSCVFATFPWISQGLGSRIQAFKGFALNFFFSSSIYCYSVESSFVLVSFFLIQSVILNGFGMVYFQIEFILSLLDFPLSSKVGLETANYCCMTDAFLTAQLFSLNFSCRISFFFWISCKSQSNGLPLLEKQVFIMSQVPYSSHSFLILMSVDLMLSTGILVSTLCILHISSSMAKICGSFMAILMKSLITMQSWYILGMVSKISFMISKYSSSMSQSQIQCEELYSFSFQVDFLSIEVRSKLQGTQKYSLNLYSVMYSLDFFSFQFFSLRQSSKMKVRI